AAGLVADAGDLDGARRGAHEPQRRVVARADVDAALVLHREARAGLDGQGGPAVDVEVAQDLDERLLGAPGRGLVDGAAEELDALARAVAVAGAQRFELVREQPDRALAVGGEAHALELAQLGALPERQTTEVVAEAAAGQRGGAVDAQHAWVLGGAAVVE